MKKIGNFGYQLFNVLFLFFPAVVCVMSLRAVASLALPLVSAVCFVLCLLAAFGVLLLLYKRSFPNAALCALSVVLAVALRLAFLFYYGGDMVMLYDYKTALESAEGTFAAKEAIFTSWAFYPRILSVWMAVFGKGYFSAACFSVFVNAASVALLYCIVQKLWQKQAISFLAAIILALWPSLAGYSMVTSNEHLCVLAMLLAVLLLICAWKAKRAAARWALVCAAGAAAGAADLFKEFSPIFFIAVAITALIFWLTESRSLKALGFMALMLLLMVLFAKGLKAGAYAYLESYLGVPVAKSVTAHFLYVGLNSESHGVWSETVGKEVYRLAEKYDNDYDRVMSELWTLLKEDLRNNPGELPETIMNKLKIDWAADTGVVDWVYWLYDGGEEQMPHAALLYAASAGYYLAAIFGLSVSAVFSFKKKDAGTLYYRLSVFGFALVLLLSEAQGRYQLVLFPAYAVLCAGGLNDMLVWAGDRIKYRKS